MAKIKLNLDADDNLDFERAVTIPETTVKKNPLRVTFTFKYRNRLEVAALFDGYIERARAAIKEAEERAEAGVEERKSMAEYAKEGIKRDIETTLDIATGWNIDAPFDEEHLTMFFTKYPGAGQAIADDYRISLTQGRLGN